MNVKQPNRLGRRWCGPKTVGQPSKCHSSPKLPVIRPIRAAIYLVRAPIVRRQETRPVLRPFEIEVNAPADSRKDRNCFFLPLNAITEHRSLDRYQINWWSILIYVFSCVSTAHLIWRSHRVAVSYKLIYSFGFFHLAVQWDRPLGLLLPFTAHIFSVIDEKS